MIHLMNLFVASIRLRPIIKYTIVI